MRASVCVPASIAGLSTGNVASSSAVAGVSCCPSVVRSARNGCSTVSESVPTASVDGDSAIDASSALGSLEIASNVVAMSVNSREATRRHRRHRPHERCSATAGTGSARCSESDRYRATGSRCPSSAGRLAIVSFSAEPRPASASPMPTRFPWIARRVAGIEGLEDVLELNRARLSARSAACRRPRSGSSMMPLCRSTYFDPSTDSGRIEAVESTGTLPVRVVQPQRQLRADPAARPARIGASAETSPIRIATLAHVAADDQVRAVGDVDPQLLASARTAVPRSRCTPGTPRASRPGPSPRRPGPGWRGPIAVLRLTGPSRSWSEEVVEEALRRGRGLGGACGRVGCSPPASGSRLASVRGRRRGRWSPSAAAVSLQAVVFGPRSPGGAPPGSGTHAVRIRRIGLVDAGLVGPSQA